MTKFPGRKLQIGYFFCKSKVLFTKFSGKDLHNSGNSPNFAFDRRKESIIMLTICPIKTVNNHIIIDDGQNILVDTGSPVSFHKSGILVLGNTRINVFSSLPMLSTEFLSVNIGCQIDGLLGMDLMNKVPTSIRLNDGIMVFDDDARYSTQFQMYPLSIVAGGLLAIRISVNHKEAKMVVDTGAQISYIREEFIRGQELDKTMDDFSPYNCSFKTDTYICEVDTLIGHPPFSQRFGIPPKEILSILDLFQADGIIGIDLFRRYDLQIRGGALYT